jgi:hypothetical protein
VRRYHLHPSLIQLQFSTKTDQGGVVMDNKLLRLG